MRICAKCTKDMPVYDGGVNNGFVQPTPARTEPTKPAKEESQFLDFTQGPLGMTVTAKPDDSPVCAECYLELFAIAYPGAELPRMPRERD